MHIQRLTQSVTIFALFLLIPNPTEGKSLYVDVIEPQEVRAYKIVGDYIQYQTNVQNLASHGGGPVGLAIDPGTGIGFVTYETSIEQPGVYAIEMFNARTMVSLQNPIDTLLNNLAGIAFDSQKQKLYVMSRGTNNLLVYLWNARRKQLFLEGETYKVLAEVAPPYRAYGIALDSESGLLYVTDRTNTVKFYDTSAWQYKGSIPIVVSGNTREAVGIAIDSKRHYMYTGSFYGTGGYHYYIVRTDISDPNNPSFSEKYIGAYAIGLAVDEDTGLLYVGVSPPYAIRVYNTLTWPSDPCYIDSNNLIAPTGMWVGDDVEYKPPNLILTKTTDVAPGDCNEPNDIITYTITYNGNGHSDTNVVITDYLPEEITFLDVEIAEPYFLIFRYDPERHAVIWEIGDVGPNDTNSIGIIVQVNNLAEPEGALINTCKIEGDSSYNFVEVNTPVCSWNPGVIYVDCDRWTGALTGMSWENAYIYLQDALDRASHGCGSEIWVAEGTYKPSGATFQLVNGIPVYGHFAGNETSINQRNLHNPNNETILTGLLDDYPTYADYVVTATNVNAATILDGFSITQGYYSGITITGGSPTISNCNIRANLGHGLCSSESHVTVSNCTIADNGYDGINIPQTLVAKTVKVKDNFIHNNGTNGTGSGINITFYYTVYPQVTIRNNTILNNAGTGILLSLASSSPAIVTNNIIWGNNTQISGAATVTYCCVQGGYTGANNTSHDPCFINALTDPNDYHLGPASVYCIDKGKPNSTEPNETDLDGEDRVMDGDYNNTFIVDIGADEHFFPRADFNRDGIVNFFDYAIFAFAWGEPNSDVNLAGDIDIEMDDLAAFCADWLWIAPWSDLYETLMSQADSGMNMFIAEQSMAVEADMLESSEMSLSFDEQLVPAESPDIVRLIDWLDDAWLAGEITEALTEQEYLDFRQSLADSAE